MSQRTDLTRILCACLVAWSAWWLDSQVHAEPAVTPLQADGGTAPPPDAGAAQPVAPELPPDVDEDETAEELRSIRRDTEELQRLLDGRPTEGLDLAALLGVDLLDEDAVGRRIDELRVLLEADRRELAELERASESDELPTTPDAGFPDAGLPDALPLDPARYDAGLPDGGPPDAGPEALTPEAEAGLARDRERRRARLLLTTARDELAMRFLERPQSERFAALVLVDPERRRVVEQLQTAAASQEAAQEAAREADEARQQALDTASHASAEGARQLATERAQVEAVRAEIARNRSRFAHEREQLARQDHEHIELANEVRSALESATFSPSQADELYRRVVAALTVVRTDFAGALDRISSPTSYQPHQLRLDPGAEVYRRFPGERGRLAASLRQMEREGLALGEEESSLRWESTEVLAAALAQLNDSRYDLLPRLSTEERERVLGLGATGQAQLRREVRNLQLVARWQLVRLPRTLGEILGETGDILARSSSRWVVIQLVFVVLCIILVFTRRQRLWAVLRSAVERQFEGSRSRGLADWWLALLGAVGLPLTMLVLVWLAFWLLGKVTDSRGLSLFRAIFLAYAWYRLIVAATHHFFVSAASTAHRVVSERTSAKIFRTVQVLGLTVLLIFVFLVSSAHLVGRGYLYTLVVEFAWVGVFPIGYFLIRYWRNEIFDVYLGVFHEGLLSTQITKQRESALGVLLLVPAFLLLSARAIVIYTRESAMRFDRTRRALAYLFRRRLQKQGAALAATEVQYGDLPEALTTAFRSFSVPAEALVDHFPHLDETLASIEAWRAGGEGTSIALVGERGLGKTTWIQQLSSCCKEELACNTLEETLVTEPAVCVAICRALELEEVETVDELVAAINDGPRRLIVLDHCQNLMLRSVGGMRGLIAFTHVMLRTMHRTFWICSFSRYAWEHVEFALRDIDAFNRIYLLQAWSEGDLAQLIERRMSSCGLEARFEDLVVGRESGPAFEDELRRTRERYYRLLWDSTDGVPRAAMLCWIRSLVVDADGELRVRLFESPDPNDLERLHDQARFVLLAVVSQENLSVEEAVRVLAFPRARCQALLEMLLSQGYLKRRGDQYRVSMKWGPAVVRYLRRKHLLYT